MHIDIHNHAVQRPFGKKLDEGKPEQHSIWYKTKLNFLLKWLTQYITFAKFTQSDFTGQANSDTRIVMVSLYPIEKEFFHFKYKIFNSLGLNLLLGNLVTSLGKKRIREIIGTNDYFEGFEKEYHFLLEGANKNFLIGNQNWQYRIATGFKDIDPDFLLNKSKNTIYVIPTVEGMHILNQSIMPTGTTAITDLIQKIKDQYPLFFVGLAHHFWNGLCGHAPSLNSGYSKYFLDQSANMETAILPEGYAVIDALLSKENGKRIYIDIKHMSVAARLAYYAYLDEKYKEENIPIIVSHGSCNGLEKVGKKFITYGMNKTAMILKKETLNIYDEEILRIAASNGIFGLQLDKKRLVNPDYLVPNDLSFLVWNQIEHIVVLLDRNRRECWDILAIGTDNDGIVNPLQPFWTANELPHFKICLEIHLRSFLKDYLFYHAPNKIPEELILHKIFFDNAWQFLKRYW